MIVENRGELSSFLVIVLLCAIVPGGGVCQLGFVRFWASSSLVRPNKGTAPSVLSLAFPIASGWRRAGSSTEFPAAGGGVFWLRVD